MTTCNICYDLNLLDLLSKISQKLGVNREISIATTNMRKDIYKTAFIEKQAGKNTKLDNYPDFTHPHIVPTRLSEQLIPIINTYLISEAVISHS